MPRVSVCCRVVVRDRHGVWTAVTDDLCARGCQIVTSRLLRAGTRLHVTLSSDQFWEELHTVGKVAWATADRLGIIFVEGESAGGALSPVAWLDKVLEHGEMPESATTGRVAPSVQRSGTRSRTTTSTKNGRLVRTASQAPGASVERPDRAAAEQRTRQPGL